MFEDPEDKQAESASDPARRAAEKGEEMRMHAELAAIYEGAKKFDAEFDSDFDPQLAREIQRTVGKLDKARSVEMPVLQDPHLEVAAGLLDFPETHGLSTNDYHFTRRPGEVLMVRWIVGEQVDSFFERLQAHFDAAMRGLREDETQALEWKADAATKTYLKALDAFEIKLEDRWLRELIRRHGLFVMNTQSADEMNIAFLCDLLMGVPAAEIVGAAAAPPDNPSDSDLAWFFKVFSLRGIRNGEERICFFTFLQKSDESFGGD